jgi:hypothetical protein
VAALQGSRLCGSGPRWRPAARAQTPLCLIFSHALPHAPRPAPRAPLSQPPRVQAGRDRDLPIYFGDAGSAAVLHAVGAERAACAVITLDTPGAGGRCRGEGCTLGCPRSTTPPGGGGAPLVDWPIRNPPTTLPTPPTPRRQLPQRVGDAQALPPREDLRPRARHQPRPQPGEGGGEAPGVVRLAAFRARCLRWRPPVPAYALLCPHSPLPALAPPSRPRPPLPLRAAPFHRRPLLCPRRSSHRCSSRPRCCRASTCPTRRSPRRWTSSGRSTSRSCRRWRRRRVGV